MTIWYTICFSLDEPKKNQYIYSLLLLYKSLKRSGSLQPEDLFLILADKQTAEEISKYQILQQVKIAVLPKPDSVYSGMKLKYLLPELIQLHPDQVCVYCDLDLLFVKPIRIYLPSDYICVFPEGEANDTNYCGDPTTAPFDPPRKGYTAGFFAYKAGEKVKAFFCQVLQALKEPKKYYTLDQPYFNRFLPLFNKVEFDPKLISFNGHNNLPNATIINCCGEPGDDQLHFSKQLQFFLSTV